MPLSVRIAKEVAERHLMLEGAAAEERLFHATRNDELQDRRVRAIAAARQAAILLTLTTEGEFAFGRVGSKFVKKKVGTRSGVAPTVFLARALVVWATIVAPGEPSWAAYDDELADQLPIDRGYRGALTACVGLANAEDDDRVVVPPGVETGLLLARASSQPITADLIAAHRETAQLFFVIEALRQIAWHVLDELEFTRAADGLTSMNLTYGPPDLPRWAAQRAAWTHAVANLRPAAAAAMAGAS